MKAHKSYGPNLENTPENVKYIVDARFDRKPDEAMPELLSKFSTLLGNEKEEWEGVAAMKVCMEEFKKGRQHSNYHQRDLEAFLFSRNRYIPIVIPGSDRPSTSGPVIPGVVGQTSVPPANPKTLKAKIYMGSGWKIDFPELPPPSLWVNIKVQGDKSQKKDKSHKNDQSKKTKVQKKTWTPCWGEEFEFSLSTFEDAKLSLEVYNEKSRYGFAGKACVPVSELKSGIRVIPLSDDTDKQYSSTWLLMRFMFII